MRIMAIILMMALTSTPALAQWARQAPGMQPDPAPQSMARPAAEAIVAVVNDDVITTRDVAARLALAMVSANIPDSPEIRKQLYPQVLNSLIDEQLQQQEGRRLNITVSTAEIDQALAKLAADNNIPGGDMRAYLQARGQSADSLVNQARAALTWNKVAMRTLRPRVDIGEDEVDAVIERQRADAGKKEYLVSEIFIAIDRPTDETKATQFATDLMQRIKSGAPFGAMARQFSQGSSAANGGDLGWVQADQLPTELDRALKQMQPGQMSELIRTAEGLHILGLRESRTVAINTDRDTITNQIGMERMELQARRLLRDLRRNAHLDIRMQAPALN